MQKFFPVILFFLCVTATWSQKKETEPVRFNPTVKKLEETVTVETDKKFYVGKVENACKDSTIGFTRTGLRTRSPLMSDPSPELVTENSLVNVFNNKKILTSDPSKANYMVEVKVLKYKLKEDSKFLHQVMSSVVAIEVKVTDPYDTTKVHQFKVESKGERTAFDTTKHAGSVMRQALQGVIGEILKSIDKL
ncbi:MAG: hypothetical protein ACLFQB_04195 [Chitinispirillaceae bacterium]